MAKHICKQCGTVFDASPYQDRKGHDTYCSRECSAKATTMRGKDSCWWKGGKIFVCCQKCGKEFETYQSKITRGGGKYCSKQCSGSLSHRNRITLAKIKKACQQCGTEFEVIQSRPTARFCSRKCANIAHREEISGPRNSFWKGGISNTPYDNRFTYSFKKAIRGRDKHACAICGKYGKDIHHIDSNKLNSIPGNCITLCHKCHMKIELSPSLWQGKLEAIVQEHTLKDADTA